MTRTTAKSPRSKAAEKKVARLYHFGPKTVAQIEFLSHLFGGKEKGIAAAVDMAANVLKGESSELQISIK
ncbi:MAG TPA: hypothetical protein VNU21_16910 [Usitatibacter sp.]|jgi:hypothetical protein|nr:hypothetical protein [Usitatibacter sp.]